MRRPWAREWPTWLVVIAVYGGFFAITWFHAAIPWFVAVPIGAMLLAWHSSLQHEIIHGHPTGRRRFDTALGAIPLSIWLPYVLYRSSHLRHHRNQHLTCPIEDPESYYVTAETWNRLSPAAHGVLIAHRTLLGRLVLGPALAMAGTWVSQARKIIAGDRACLRMWALHLVLAALVLGWAIGVAGVPAWMYAAWVYCGLSLTLVRSFAEHRAAPASEQRTAVVDRAPLFGLLFLHNNLHVAHHARPGLPWYRLPELARTMDARGIAARGAGLYHGYAALAARHLLRPLDHPVHPAQAASAVATDLRPARSDGTAGPGVAA